MHLQGRIKELGDEKAALRVHIDAQTGSIAQLKSVATAAVADKEAAEAARRISLDSYARQLCVTAPRQSSARPGPLLTSPS